ncbi:hypothetical protein LPB86_01025 [Pedobacter sp. MC2016-14]|uniref:hypothetical protein n=1 Tax=Pedobacter sp. MC2016-14 TaxID=2897327 RepID=UPI001E2B9897|nr:hypothetical protein [Pedobacter sp. MC2016-14]MCD0486789.1 hypothetical protein [Pedobacter sp. MC2016-14]
MLIIEEDHSLILEEGYETYNVNQKAQFDKVFRENMEMTLPGLIKDVLHLHVHTIEEIPDNLQHTKERKVDLLKKVIDANGNIFILHVEYQRGNDSEIALRMAEYAIMLQRKYKLPVLQFLIYIGSAEPVMPTRIDTAYMHFWFNMIPLSTIDYKVFLSSDRLEQRMLALLGNFNGDDPKLLLEKILDDIEAQDLGELAKGKCRKQLRVLLELRNFEEIIKEDMELGPIFEIERDILYIRGERKGKLAGELKGKLETAKGMKSENLSFDLISKITGLAVDEIKRL